VTPEKFGEIRRSEVRPGDILLTTKGTVGDVCLMPELPGPSVLSASGTVRLRLPATNELLGPVVVWQMILPSYKRYLHSFEAGSAQQYLNLTGIKKMKLMVPPEAKQKEFVRLREAIGRMKELAAFGRKETEKLFSSLVARAFRGELENGLGRVSTSKGSAC
jgi:type I restriction enzyme S subunit